MLKIATMDDLDTIMSMGLRFVEVSGYKDFATPEGIEEVIIQVLNMPKHEGIVLLGENSMLLGVAKPFAFNPRILVASEIAWWVDPSHRKSGQGAELLGAFEYWAKEKAGCSLCVMVSLDDSIGKIYEKNGYVLQERMYMKNI